MIAPDSLKASASAKAVDSLKPFWSMVVGAGRAAEGLRADWQQHLRLASASCGFQYVRFHGIFHDDMHVYNETDGEVFYNFQYVDALFDAMLDMGVKPFIEFGFCPSALATHLATTFWWKANGSPPKDIIRWADMISASVQHWVDRYGLAEVETWYFEVWNEPNLSGFWKGTRTQYYELYEATAKAVKSVASSLRVGGPSTSNFVPDARFDGDREDMEVQKPLADIKDIDSLSWRPVWVEHFLDWCSQRGLPVDFVSCHPYPTDWALDSSGNQSKRVRQVDAAPQDFKLIRNVVEKSLYPQAEVHLTEWSSSPSSRDHNHDYVPAATYIVRTMISSINSVTSVAYWTFTDVFEEDGAGATPFHGGFGMINMQGIPKPSYHAFRLLGWLHDEVLQLHPETGIVTRDSKTGLLSALLYHYPPEMKTGPPPAYKSREVAEETVATGSPTKKCLALENIKPGTAFRMETLAPNGPGDVVSAWKDLGAPKTLSRDVVKHLQHFSSPSMEFLKANADGRVCFERELAPWTVVALQQIAQSR